jgi:hypothetical protein
MFLARIKFNKSGILFALQKCGPSRLIPFGALLVSLETFNILNVSVFLRLYF